MDRWLVLKDILLTGTGLALVLTQLFTARPSDVLIVAGLALTTPSVYGHAKAILSGHTGSSSSPPSPPDGPSPSTSSPPRVPAGGE